MSNCFDAHADTYSEDIDKTLRGYGVRHELFTAHKAWLIGRVTRAEGQDESRMDLLDVGCGVGKLHAYLKDRFRKIVGVDVSADSLKVARAMNSEVDYRDYDGLRLPFPDRSFDMAAAIAVFHHVPPAQWQLTANEMIRVLRPGGIAVVIEHNPYNPVTRRIVRTCPLDADAVLLRPGKIRQLFAGAGAERIRTRSIISLPPLNGWLRTIDTAFARLPFGAQYYMVARRSAEAH